MSNNETKDKRRQEQLFYLQLKHTHDNDFEAMLSHEEKRLWAMFSDGHKRLFGLSRDWEWLVKCSLQRFTDAEKITRCSDWAEVAQMRFNYFRKESQSCKKIMAVDDLTDFLFPFLDLEGEQFRSELIEQIKYESVIGPEAHPEKYTREWEVYGVNCVEIRLKWLESRDSDYLKAAAAVWEGYLGAAKQGAKKPEVKPEVKSRVNKNTEWDRLVQKKHQSKPVLSHVQICRQLEAELGVSAETIRRRTTNPKPRNKQK